MRRVLPLFLILLGTALLITAVVFWVDSNTSAEPQSFGKILLDWVTLISGLGASIKGWIDLFKKEKSAPPTVAFDIEDSNLQTSTGENARNIQAQVYIEKQIVQHTLESRKTSQKKKRETLETSDAVDDEQKSNNGSMIRFLDSLDSARYSHQTIYDNSRLLSVLYVKAQFFLAIVTGDSIVVTENQFFDSLGFLESFDELHRAAEAVNLETDLPIRVALRANNTNVFQAVANNIGNEAFVLTLWKDLESDLERRKLWAEQIRNEQRPGDEIVLEGERLLLDKLWTALKYFTPNRCVSADNIPAEFSTRIKKIIEMKNEDLDDLHSGKSEGVQQRKYLNTSGEIEAARKIRDALIEIQGRVGEIKTRSQIRRELASFDEEELKEGVIEFSDGIYNQTLGIASGARLIQSSTFPPRRNKYVTAGYSLSTFVQDTSNSRNNFMNWEIFSFDYFKDLEALSLDDFGRKDELIQILEAARKNTPWNKLLEMQNSASWRNDLENFHGYLSKLQSVVKAYSIGSLTDIQRESLEKERKDYQNALEKSWRRHISKMSKIVNNNYWSITETEISFSLPNHPYIHYPIRISYTFLKTKINMAGDQFENWLNYSAFKGRMDSRSDQSR